MASVLAPAGQKPFVFRARDGVAERVFVEAVELRGDQVAIRGAVEAGDLVLHAGHTSLLHGERIEVAK